ncbi:MAG: peptidase [candidate division Zixibacteria bacterium SM23_81]|nr:MAG: peptidase [candidate division Zixibacteria bacterium SM23_81]
MTRKNLAGGQNQRSKIPGELPILPLKGIVVFPNIIVPLVVSQEEHARLIDETLVGGKIVGLFLQMGEKSEERDDRSLYDVGTAGQIIKMLRFPDGSVRFLVQGAARIKIKKFLRTEPYLVARVERIKDHTETSIELEALVRNLLEQFGKVVSLAPYLPDDLQISAMNIEQPGKLADLIASNLNMPVESKQDILDTASVKERLMKLTSYVNRELNVLELGKQIQSRAASEMGRDQKEYFLREQLKAIQHELGETDQKTAEIEEFRKKIAAARMPSEALEAANRELDRLSRIPPAAAEYTVSRTFLDWLVSLPWSKGTKDNLDIPRAKQVLDEDHYNLEKVKERILEYLAVRKLKAEMKGPILCFVGPPGVGKTSLGRSIARALGREFVRISLGGMRDEAEIRGHRRTYVGALPGRIIQGIRRAGFKNPVFMLDEVDKIGQDFRGDPAAALLEVLDPEQNNSFSDHYLEVPFDLSRVMFITTANILDPIPGVLRDRMEVIDLPGYTDEEKLHIAKKYLVLREREEHGLKEEQIQFQDEALREIISKYTLEAGLRNLDREIATVCRKVAKRVAEGEVIAATVAPDNLSEYLGPEKFFREMATHDTKVGVVPSLAWTQTGGAIMFVEATKMPGRKSLILTGQLGDVMKESAQAALSYVRASAKKLKIPEDFFSKVDIHVHVPAGAIPKDGPSAGITIATAIASLLTGKPIKPELSMTGEITLRGEVLPIGGVKQKALAAHRAGIKTVVLPKKNEKDLVEVPEEIRKGLDFVFVETVDEVFTNAFGSRSRRVARPRKTPRAR